MLTDHDYHIHANYNDHSDPDLTIQNIIKKAFKINLKSIAITEHIRKSSNWVEKYLDEINDAKDNCDLEIFPGFEAKILHDGSIDCLEKYAKDNFIIASFHTVYNEKSVWKNALKNAIKDPLVNVIGHLAPEPTFVLDGAEVYEIADLLVENEKIMEINAKYQRPSIEWIKKFLERGVKFHLGSDAHSLKEIGDYNKIRNLIDTVDLHVQHNQL